MGEHFSRRSFVRLAATASSAVVIGFDPRARSWITQAWADTGPWEGVPKLDGTLLQDEVSRQAIAVDKGNMFRLVPTAVLKPGSVREPSRAQGGYEGPRPFALRPDPGGSGHCH